MIKLFRKFHSPPEYQQVLLGQYIVAIEKSDYAWHLRFSGCDITVESLWRVKKGDDLILTSNDNGQLFGRAEPINAADELLKYAGKSCIMAAKGVRMTGRGDLDIHFQNGVLLQFIATSAGYENWQIHYRKGEQIRIFVG